jgi:transposase
METTGTAITDPRQVRGLQIAKASRLKRVTDHHWVVPSQTGAGKYLVDAEKASCSCPDHELRGLPCKHVFAVEYARHRIAMPDGTTITTETMKVTYTQNWPAYNAAQTTEKAHVQQLLRDLCEGIVQPPYVGKGRPCLALSDVVYGAVMKVYTGMSGRRATTDIVSCEERGLIDHAPHYNSIFHYLERADLTPLLKKLIEESAEPLKSVETNFAVDATGFSTKTYRRWYDAKYGKEMKEARWVKAHAMIGVQTNIITAVEVTEGFANDSPQFPGLVKTTGARGFKMDEVSADKAYLSSDHLALVADHGGMMYVPFRSNCKGAGSEHWRKLWHLYNFKKHEFLRHYHLRSNVESTFSAVKRLFGASVRSKLLTAQLNEVLAKLLCYNLTVLVHSFHDLGIEPAFGERMRVG